jgi:hypothetical protein
LSNNKITVVSVGPNIDAITETSLEVSSVGRELQFQAGFRHGSRGITTVGPVIRKLLVKTQQTEKN